MWKEVNMLFKCPVCQKKRWFPAKIQNYYVSRLKQTISSNDKQCRICRKVLKIMIEKM